MRFAMEVRGRQLIVRAYRDEKMTPHETLAVLSRICDQRMLAHVKAGRQVRHSGGVDRDGAWVVFSEFRPRRGAVAEAAKKRERIMIEKGLFRAALGTYEAIEVCADREILERPIGQMNKALVAVR